MKHFQQQTVGMMMLLALAVPALPAYGTPVDAQQVRWNEVCRVAGNREVTITTEDGNEVVGYCVAIDAKAMSVKTKDHRVVDIARHTLKRLEVQTDVSELRELHKDGHRGLRFGVRKLFSPAALVGMVVVPTVLAWGTVTLPFCALGDLGSRGQGKKEIKPI